MNIAASPSPFLPPPECLLFTMHLPKVFVVAVPGCSVGQSVKFNLLR